MVSTRNHPKNFPPPQLSPSKAVSTTTSSSSGGRSTSSRNTSKTWTHTPSNLTLVWLAIAVPTVTWDALYIFLRPHSMHGGKLYRIWAPYGLYANVDYTYGWPAYSNHVGFGPAQSALNVVETTMYAWYLYLVFSAGRAEPGKGRGAPTPSRIGWLGARRSISGGKAGAAVLLGFSAAVMTVSKTALYWLNEYFSGWENIGHNDPLTLFFVWVIPNGLWLLFPGYIIYVFGREILEGLLIASGGSSSLSSSSSKPRSQPSTKRLALTEGPGAASDDDDDSDDVFSKDE
ncbi:MAG: hypothetical protein M1819_006183 [Sarea resinae]|nr:MAG: hypothetical protein M1819_006183 [Sarea resinae]